MLYIKNVPIWERWMRAMAGVAMLLGGPILLHGQALGWLIAGAGVVGALTGLIGYCPMCAMVGRKQSPR